MPEWTWSPQWKAYRDMSNGQWASRAQIQEWVTDAVELADSSTDELSRLIGDVKIDARTWHVAMREQIKEAYKQQYLLGKGGIEQMTAQDWGSIGGMIADQYRYLDKFAQQIADGKLSEGGDGSGWFAPPKGTHGPGSQGGVRWVEEPTTEQIARWGEQVAEWDAPRGGMATAALHSIRSYGDVAAIFIEEGGELKGIGSISTPEGSRRMNAWRIAPYEPDPVVSASFMGTKERGYGLRMMQGLADICIENEWELRFGAIPGSIGFFDTIGMKPVREGSTAFRLSPDELRAWRDTFSEATKEEIAAAEPDDGIFIVDGFIEGGPTSGWYAPPKGTHGPGSQGGLDPGTGEDRYRVGITSYRSGDSITKVNRDMEEFEDGLNGVAESVSVRLGTGGWEGGSEPTWLVQFRDGDDALAHIAITARKHNQDAALVMKFVEAGEGSPLVRLNFSKQLTEDQIRVIERGMVENGIGGWTWGKGPRGTALMAACVPQWGGENEAHLRAMATLREQLKSHGHNTASTTSWIETIVMERGEYGRWAG